MVISDHNPDMLFPHVRDREMYLIEKIANLYVKGKAQDNVAKMGKIMIDTRVTIKPSFSEGSLIQKMPWHYVEDLDFKTYSR